MRVGSTRKCFRGQIARARQRDQRIVAGANCSPLTARVCIVFSAGMRIARGNSGFLRPPRRSRPQPAQAIRWN